MEILIDRKAREYIEKASQDRAITIELSLIPKG